MKKYTYKFWLGFSIGWTIASIIFYVNYLINNL